MKPTRHFHPDPNWRYVPAEQTDIRKTFERARKAQKRNQPKDKKCQQK